MVNKARISRNKFKEEFNENVIPPRNAISWRTALTPLTRATAVAARSRVVSVGWQGLLWDISTGPGTEDRHPLSTPDPEPTTLTATPPVSEVRLVNRKRKILDIAGKYFYQILVEDSQLCESKFLVMVVLARVFSNSRYSPGHYMYIEVSGQSMGDIAILETPVFRKSSRDCSFEFYYNMQGMVDNLHVVDSQLFDKKRAVYA